MELHANISQDNQTLLVVPCSSTIDWNEEHSMYYCPVDRHHNEPFRYLGYYVDKSIWVIGELENCISLGYNADSKELKILDSTLECTKEQEERLKRALPSAPHPEDVYSNHKFYIVKEMIRADFEKSSKGGMLGTQYMDLSNFIGKEILQRNNIKEIAEALKQVTWINNNTPGKGIGDNMEEEALKKRRSNRPAQSQ